MAKHPSYILELARKGAEHRYRELKAEIAAFRIYPPELTRASRSNRPQMDMSSEPAATIDRPRWKARRMSPAGKAVSQRVKKYPAHQTEGSHKVVVSRS